MKSLKFQFGKLVRLESFVRANSANLPNIMQLQMKDLAVKKIILFYIIIYIYLIIESCNRSLLPAKSDKTCTVLY